MTSCLNRRFFGHNILESLSLNMGIRIQSFFTQRPHNEDGGILFKGYRIKMIDGLRKWRR